MKSGRYFGHRLHNHDHQMLYVVFFLVVCAAGGMLDWEPPAAGPDGAAVLMCDTYIHIAYYACYVCFDIWFRSKNIVYVLLSCIPCAPVAWGGWGDGGSSSGWLSFYTHIMFIYESGP